MWASGCPGSLAQATVFAAMWRAHQATLFRLAGAAAHQGYKPSKRLCLRLCPINVFLRIRLSCTSICVATLICRVLLAFHWSHLDWQAFSWWTHGSPPIASADRSHSRSHSSSSKQSAPPPSLQKAQMPLAVARVPPGFIFNNNGIGRCEVRFKFISALLTVMLQTQDYRPVSFLSVIYLLRVPGYTYTHTTRISKYASLNMSVCCYNEDVPNMRRT